LGIAGDTAKFEKIRKLYEETIVETRRELQKLRDAGRLGDEDRTSMIREVRGKREEQLKLLLTDAAFQRLQQIEWQSQGPLALLDPNMVKALELTPEQQEKLQTVNRQFVRKQQEVFTGKVDVNEIKKKIDEAADERNSAVAEILSKAQQEKQQELLGAPFDLANNDRESSGR
jgi:hypothetical protein